MEVITWSYGEKYEKSNKNQKPLLNSDNEVIHNIALRGEYIVKKNDIENEKKREEIMDRSMMRRNFQNPFLDNKSYLDVINDQEKFLTPQNSSMVKEPPGLTDTNN